MALDDLIQEVERMAPSDDPLDRLATAAVRYAELTHQADELVDHFVGQAREAGCSWASIGEQLGVTKQAAQQKHNPEKGGVRGWLLSKIDKPGLTSGLFTRFTPRARTAVTQAQEEARGLQHNYIGTEHILLGLLADPKSLASEVLAAKDIDHDVVQGAVVAMIGVGGSAPSGHIPFTPRSKKTLEVALREALALGHNYIGTEHILLALMQNDGVACKILVDRGATHQGLRDDVVKALVGIMKKQAEQATAEQEDDSGA